MKKMTRFFIVLAVLILAIGLFFGFGSFFAGLDRGEQTGGAILAGATELYAVALFYLYLRFGRQKKNQE